MNEKEYVSKQYVDDVVKRTQTYFTKIETDVNKPDGLIFGTKLPQYNGDTENWGGFTVYFSDEKPTPKWFHRKMRQLFFGVKYKLKGEQK